MPAHGPYFDRPYIHLPARLQAFDPKVLCFRVLRFRVQAFGFRLSGLGFRVQAFGFRVSGLGFRV